MFNLNVDEAVNKLKLFAGDSKLHAEFRSVGSAQNLHADLNVPRIGQTNKCQLSFNLNKWKVLHKGKK